MDDETKLGSIENIRRACEILVWVALQSVEDMKGLPPTDKRVKVFRLSLLKAARLAQAALLLDATDFIEEVLSLARTLAEVVISACYLQLANDQEVDSFLVFDSQKSYRMSTILEEFLEPSELISQEERDNLKAIIARARTQSNRRDTDKSWSIESVYGMAKKVDASMAPNTFLFTMLKAATYESGHPFVHGTYGSFSSVRQWLSEGTFPADAKRAEIRVHAVEGLYQCLAALCIYANERFQLQHRQHILAAKTLNETI
jgi:hypothetical protein